jgi:hypothetical protein
MSLDKLVRKYNAGHRKIVRRFRKVAWGRLYWKSHYSINRGMFDSDDVCVVKSGTVRMHYKSVGALLKDIEAMEIENNVGEK